jgi:hypothetical protein
VHLRQRLLVALPILALAVASAAALGAAVQSAPSSTLNDDARHEVRVRKNVKALTAAERTASASGRASDFQPSTYRRIRSILPDP